MIVRRASPNDAPGMCAVLNPLIEAGGTTAHRQTFDADRIASHFLGSQNMCCHVAEMNINILGFQSLKWPDEDYIAHTGVPADWVYISTFVDINSTQGGIGSALFKVTSAAARDAGIPAIDATIRKENAGGLKFYSRLGFEDWAQSDETISKVFTL